MHCSSYPEEINSLKTFKSIFYVRGFRCEMADCCGDLSETVLSYIKKTTDELEALKLSTRSLMYQFQNVNNHVQTCFK